MKNIHSSIKISMKIDANLGDKEVLSEWKRRTSTLCKPCWELHYCPYGPLVEDFPLLPPVLIETKEHIDYLKKCLKTGILGNRQKIDKIRKKDFMAQINQFNKNDYPDSIPLILQEASCKVFGHICPTFYVAEPLTETKHLRQHKRSIPREVMLKVVRRDGQICQECNKPVSDKEVEFDHIIPFSKGGRSIVSNLRLVHKECNRKKKASLKYILAENPVNHLWELRNKRNKKRR